MRHAMRSGSVTVAIGVLVCVMLALAPTVTHAAQTSPEGFCQSWLLLGHYTQDGGAAPGAGLIRADYLTDGSGVTEANFIPFDGATVNTNFGAAQSTGYNPGTSGAPGGPPYQVIAWDEPDSTVDYNAIYGDINDVMTYAWTYAVNPTADPIFCYVGIASDDSIQVVINTVEIGLVNAGRGYGGGTTVQNAWPCILYPGKNLVMTKVFEGGGGHGVRLRFQTHGGTGGMGGDPGLAGITYTQDSTGYYGPPALFTDFAVANRTLPANGLYYPEIPISVTVSVNAVVGQPAPTVTETVPSGWTVSNIVTNFGNPATESGGTITWSPGAMTVGTATMTYEATPPDTAAGTVNFTGSCAFTDVTYGAQNFPTGGDTELSDVELGTTELGFGRSWVILGQYDQPDPNGADPPVADMREDYLTDGAGITEASFDNTLPPVYQPINTDFGAAFSTGFTPGNPGFAQPTPFLWVDPDEGVDYNQVFGGYDFIMSYAWCIARNKTGAPLDVHVGVASDDSIQVVVNGTEIGIVSVPRGWGGANTVQDAFPVTLNDGDNIVMLKVFEGGGGFGFRCRLQTDGTTPTATVANTVPRDQAELVAVETPLAMASRSIDLPFGFYRPGVPVPVTVTVNRAFNIPDWIVTETLPTGWTAQNIDTTFGEAVASGNTITWTGLTMLADTATMTYEAIPPATATGDQSATGNIEVGPYTIPTMGESVFPARGAPLGIFDWHGNIGTPGDPSTPGSATFDNSDPSDEFYTITGGGSDVWGTADHCHAAAKIMNGDFLMDATIIWTNPGTENNWSKAGIMVRKDLTPGSPHAWAGLRDPTNGPPNNACMQWRDTQDGASAWTTASPGDTPARMRVQRTGNTVRGFIWEDPNWVELDGSPHTVPGLPATGEVLVCIYVTSHNNGTDSTAEFHGIFTMPVWDVSREMTRGYVPGGQGGQMTVTARASGNGTLSVTETVPAGLTAANPSASIGDVSTDGTNVTWTGANMTFGQTATMTYECVADAAVCNQAFEGFAGTFDFGGGPFPVGGDTVMYQESDPWPDIAPGITWTGQADIPDGLIPNGYAGFYACDNNTITVWADGSDIWGTADQFHFLYVTACGDFSMQADVEHLDPNVNGWEKAGVMARTDLEPGSPHAQAIIRQSDGHIVFQERLNRDGGSQRFNLVGDDPATNDPSSRRVNTGPATLRVERTGGGTMIGVGYDTLEGEATLSGYLTADRPNIPNDEVIYVGLAYTSHNSGTLDRARFSNVAFTGQITCGPPDAPTNLTVQTYASGRLLLRWQDNADSEEGFRIERRLGTTGSYAEVAQVGADVEQFVDSGLTNGQEYWYRVVAFNAGGDSEYSNEASGTPEATLDATRWTLYR